MHRIPGTIVILLVLTVTVTPGRSIAATPSKPAKLASVRYILHGLAVQPPHQQKRKGKPKDPLYNQYLVETKAKQRASVAFRDGTILYLNQRTDAVLRDPHTTLVKDGEVDEVHPPGTDHQVITAAATAGAVGTNFDVRVKGKRSVFIVVSGSLLVKNASGQVTVAKNQETSVVPNKPPAQPTPVDAEAAIGWTVSLSSGGWEVLKTPADLAPKGIAVDAQGNIYASDYAKDRVVKYSSAGKQLLTFGTKGTGTGQFQAPWGVAIDSHGNVFVSDQESSVIQKFTPDGQYVSEIGQRGNPGSDPGTFFSPDGLAIDEQDNIYVADQGNNRIQELSPSGQSLKVIGGLGTPPNLSEPEGLAVDSPGNIYVADTLNYQVQKLSPAGDQLAVWGTKGTALGQFDLPLDVAVDSAGDVFVADEINNRIEELGSDGDPLTAWGEHGTASGQFDQPVSLFIDKQGTLYVADSHRIQRLRGAGPPAP